MPSIEAAAAEIVAVITEALAEIRQLSPADEVLPMSNPIEEQTGPVNSPVTPMPPDVQGHW